jgi:hypothetical protein
MQGGGSTRGHQSMRTQERHRAGTTNNNCKQLSHMNGVRRAGESASKSTATTRSESVGSARNGRQEGGGTVNNSYNCTQTTQEPVSECQREQQYAVQKIKYDNEEYGNGREEYGNGEDQYGNGKEQYGNGEKQFEDDEEDDDEDDDGVECTTRQDRGLSVRSNRTYPSRTATATSDITESGKIVNENGVCVENEAIIEVCEVIAESAGRGKRIDKQRDASVKSKVEKYAKNVMFKRIKFIRDQEELGSLRENGSIGNKIMDFMMIEERSRRYSWWVLYQDVVKKAMDQQRSNCNIAIKEVVVGE